VFQSYQASSTNAAGVLRQRVREMCRTSGGVPVKPLVLYTGRANEVPTLVDELANTPCTRDAPLIGADDLSQLETAEFRDLRQGTVGQLYFTTFGPSSEQMWTQVNRASRGGAGVSAPAQASAGPTHRFFAEYRREQAAHGVAFRSGPNGHIELAYDAALLLCQAAEQWWAASPDHAQGKPAHRGLPSRQRMYELIRGTYGPRLCSGVAGDVGFGPPEKDGGRSGSDPEQKLVILQRVVRGPAGTYQVAFVCGSAGLDDRPGTTCRS
jgi:hypothetical protein